MVNTLISPESKLILQDLESGTANVYDLQALLGISVRSTYRHLKALRAANLVRIAGHERHVGGRSFVRTQNVSGTARRTTAQAVNIKATHAQASEIGKGIAGV